MHLFDGFNNEMKGGVKFLSSKQIIKDLLCGT